MKQIKIVIQSTNEIISNVANSLHLGHVAQNNAKRFYFQYREIDHDLRVKFSNATVEQFGINQIDVETRENDVQLIFIFNIDDEDYNDVIHECTNDGELSYNELKSLLIDNDVLATYDTSFSQQTLARINNVLAIPANVPNVPNNANEEELIIEPQENAGLDFDVPNADPIRVRENEEHEDRPRRPIRRRGANLNRRPDNEVGVVAQQVNDEVQQPGIDNVVHEINNAVHEINNVVNRNNRQIGINNLANITTFRDLVEFFNVYNIPFDRISVVTTVPASFLNRDITGTSLYVSFIN